MIRNLPQHIWAGILRQFLGLTVLLIHRFRQDALRFLSFLITKIQLHTTQKARKLS